MYTALYFAGMFVLLMVILTPVRRRFATIQQMGTSSSCTYCGGKNKCYNCGGKGVFYTPAAKTCSKCGGDGKCHHC